MLRLFDMEHRQEETIAVSNCTAPKQYLLLASYQDFSIQQVAAPRSHERPFPTPMTHAMSLFMWQGIEIRVL